MFVIARTLEQGKICASREIPNHQHPHLPKMRTSSLCVKKNQEGYHNMEELSIVCEALVIRHSQSVGGFVSVSERDR
jgi:hypothetical protein